MAAYISSVIRLEIKVLQKAKNNEYISMFFVFLGHKSGDLQYLTFLHNASLQHSPKLGVTCTKYLIYLHLLTNNTPSILRFTNIVSINQLVFKKYKMIPH